MPDSIGGEVFLPKETAVSHFIQHHSFPGVANVPRTISYFTGQCSYVTARQMFWAKMLNWPSDSIGMENCCMKRVGFRIPFFSFQPTAIPPDVMWARRSWLLGVLNKSCETDSFFLVLLMKVLLMPVYTNYMISTGNPWPQLPTDWSIFDKFIITETNIP